MTCNDKRRNVKKNIKKQRISNERQCTAMKKQQKQRKPHQRNAKQRHAMELIDLVRVGMADRLHGQTNSRIVTRLSLRPAAMHQRHWKD